MDKKKKLLTSRRDFLGTVVPACALSCVASQCVIASALRGEVPDSPDDKHKFEHIMDREITYKRWMQQRHNKYIGILKRLEKQIGREPLLEMLENASYEENVELGKRLSDRIPSLKVFADPFRDENSNLSKTLVREIVEDNDNAFEIKVTECLEEIVFREADAAHLGYACICHADFGLPVGINSKLKLIRTKTLMQGEDCCNHRYVWEA